MRLNFAIQNFAGHTQDASLQGDLLVELDYSAAELIAVMNAYPAVVSAVLEAMSQHD